MNKKIWIPKYNYYSKRLSMWQEKLWREVNGKPFMGILDNIAGRKTFEYATFGECGIQQSNSKLFEMQPEPMVIPPQQMTAACVWNASNAASGGGTNGEFVVNRNTGVYDTQQVGTSSTIDYLAYGYSVTGEHWYTTFGSIGTITDSGQYVDGGSTTRTIKGLYDTDPGGTGGGDLYFALNGTSLSNSDTTWLDFTWDDTAGTPRTVDRSVDMTYTASQNGSTHWRDLTPSFSWANGDNATDFVITTS